jgi:hypothetical protein
LTLNLISDITNEYPVTNLITDRQPVEHPFYGGVSDLAKIFHVQPSMDVDAKTRNSIEQNGKRRTAEATSSY